MAGRTASRSGVAIALTLLLAACNVIESQRVTLEAPPSGYNGGTPCASALGSYALPKSFVRIKIGQKKGSAPEVVLKNDDQPVEVKKHPDPHLFFCLDHLNSNTSDDRISILKWPTPGNDPKGSFLGAVLINVTDQTAYVIRALIRTAFIAISGQPDFAGRAATIFAPTEIVGDFEFDPFNQREAATINSRLTKLGFCVMLEDPMFNAPGSVQQYCSSPLKHAVNLTPFYKAYHKLERTPADPFIQGILYRAPQPYRFLIYHRRDSADEWQLQQTTTVHLENLSPVLSLRVTRAIFANRTMNFVFSEGALHTACVSKGSELLGFVDIPLEIARSIVAVPGAIAMVRIGDVNSEKELIAAQTKLATMQETYMQAVLGNKTDVGTAKQDGKPTPAPTLDLLAPPSGIAQLGAAVKWDTDLFGTALNTICRGDWS